MSKDINIVSRGTKQVGQRLLPWIFPIVLLVVWQIASSSGLLENRILPAPTAVVSAFGIYSLAASFGSTLKSVQDGPYSDYLLVVV